MFFDRNVLIFFASKLTSILDEILTSLLTAVDISVDLCNVYPRHHVAQFSISIY